MEPEQMRIYLLRVSKCVLCVLVCHLLHITQAGKYVYQTTTNDNKYYFLNDLGLKVTGNSPLTFDVMTCQDGLIRFAETQDLMGNYYDVVLGAGSNTWSGLRDRCGGCVSSVMYSGSILSCSDYKALWVMWDGSGSISIGTGSDIGKSVILSFTDTSPFEFHYIAVASYYGVTGDWRILIDESPVFTAPFADGSTSIWISEANPEGETILDIIATDPENDKLIFSIVNDYGGQFEIAGAKLKLKKSLNFEAITFYDLIISVSDGANEVNASITLTVIDVCDEIPEVLVSSVMTVPEELPTGTVIGPLFTATDKDQNDFIVFTLSGADSSHLSINSSTGDIAVVTRIDRDGADGSQVLDQLTLSAVDSCGLSVSVNLSINVIDVNDNAPKFEPAIVFANITENSTADIHVTTLNITDKDSDNNANVTLTLIDGDDPVNPIFSLFDRDIRADGQRVDYEGGPADHRYILTIQATDMPDDGRKLTATCIVIVNILSKNEHIPEWRTPTLNTDSNFSEIAIPESTTVGSSLITLMADDLDEGEDGNLEYSIVSVTMANGTTTSSPFYVDTKTGLLQTSSMLDRDELTGGTEFYDIAISVTDRASQARTSQGILRIMLTDVNDNPPRVLNIDTVYVIHCSNDVGDVVALLNVTDADDTTEGYFYELVYSELNVLTLNQTSGEFSLKSKLPGAEDITFTAVATVNEDIYGVTFVIEFQINCSNSSGLSSVTTSSVITDTTQKQRSTTSSVITDNTRKQISTTKETPTSDHQNADVIETWSLRAACGVLALTLIVSCTGLVIRHMLRSSVSSGKENRVSPTRVSSTSPSECSTNITTYTSVESLDYFQ